MHSNNNILLSMGIKYGNKDFSLTFTLAINMAKNWRLMFMSKKVSNWDVLMKIEESQRSVLHMNKFCMDMTCLFDSLKHSVIDYADNKPEGKDLYCHNDTLSKETDGYIDAIDEAMQKLKECKDLLNAFLE